jgi:hypothetical protein
MFCKVHCSVEISWRNFQVVLVLLLNVQGHTGHTAKANFSRLNYG